MSSGPVHLGLVVSRRLESIIEGKGLTIRRVSERSSLEFDSLILFEQVQAVPLSIHWLVECRRVMNGFLGD